MRDRAYMGGDGTCPRPFCAVGGYQNICSESVAVGRWTRFSGWQGRGNEGGWGQGSDGWGLGLGFRNLEGHAFGNADLRFASMR